jgi:hypothetical protein
LPHNKIQTEKPEDGITLWLWQINNGVYDLQEEMAKVITGSIMKLVEQVVEQRVNQWIEESARNNKSFRYRKIG